jgi:hypothetical protein
LKSKLHNLHSLLLITKKLLSGTGSSNLAPQVAPIAVVEPQDSQNPDWSLGIGRTDGGSGQNGQARGRGPEGTGRVGVESNGMSFILFHIAVLILF